MADFSKEYIDAIGSEMISDFAYIEELMDEKDGNEVFRICEGFGSIGAMKCKNEPYLIFLNSDPLPLSKVISIHKDK